MIYGDITLEDTRIRFEDTYRGTVKHTVIDIPSGVFEKAEVPADKFYAALAIAIHIDGMPEFEKDYPEAESIMPKNSLLRWIP